MPYQVVIEPSGKRFTCQEGETILRAGLKAGVRLPYSCNSGLCSSCKGFLIEGDVQLRFCSPFALTQSEREEGFILCCQAVPQSDCVVEIEELPLTRGELLPVCEYTTELVGVEPLTHDMSIFRFLIRDGKEIRFRAGQYALLTVPGTAQKRAYSMSNSPSQADRFEFVIKRIPNGLATTYLFEKARLGELFQIEGPYGFAYLREEDPRDILCIAGGSGISPILAIVRRALELRMDQDRRIHIYYGGRTPRDIFHTEELEQWERERPNFRFIPAISHPAEGDLEHWAGEVGLITDVVAKHLHDYDDLKVYMAGPTPMTKAALKVLIGKKKLRAEDIHYDEFG
jgi:NAD(P)H-flavin reductase/ferredoxin